jgi:hypothetical protein
MMTQLIVTLRSVVKFPFSVGNILGVECGNRGLPSVVTCTETLLPLPGEPTTCVGAAKREYYADFAERDVAMPGVKQFRNEERGIEVVWYE